MLQELLETKESITVVGYKRTRTPGRPTSSVLWIVSCSEVPSNSYLVSL